MPYTLFEEKYDMPEHGYPKMIYCRACAISILDENIRPIQNLFKKFTRFEGQKGILSFQEMSSLYNMSYLL